MKWYQIATFAVPAQAALRFGCSTLSIQRLDPLVEPGKLPSAHVHQIVGGNAFNATMQEDPSTLATCTTCTFSEDFRYDSPRNILLIASNRCSNYWTAAMFFKHTNGSYKRVPIMQNSALPNGINGGMSQCLCIITNELCTDSVPTTLQLSTIRNKISTVMVIRR